MFGVDALVGGVMNIAGSAYNNWLAGQRTDHDRHQNYLYGEMTADAADRRTRALYNDFYSPEALARQYKEAGLSPGLMFGGTPGQGGMSGAQGAGVAGPQTPVFGVDLMQAAQIANIKAQTAKTEAETANITKDTDLKKLEEQYNQFRNNEKSIEFKLTTAYLHDGEGNVTSMFELAENSRTYEDFINECKERSKNSGEKELQLMMGTEQGQKTMRDIYYNANRMSRDIAVLSSEKVDAKFQENLLEALSKKGFAEQNAETCIAQLEAAAEMANLTKQQKESFNNVIEQLKKKNSTVADILIVVSMILGNFMSGSVSVSKKL